MDTKTRRLSSPVGCEDRGHLSLRRWRDLIVGICALTIGAIHPAYGIPAVEHWTTANGARVYFVPAPELPMVDIQMVFDAGSARDGTHPGVAMLTNRLLDDGAGGLDADAIAAGFEALGAQFSVGSHRDMAILNLRSLSADAYLQPALGLFAQCAGGSDFPPDALARERTAQLVEIQAQQEAPDAIVEQAFFTAIYPDHPYASPPLGTKTDVERITPDDIVQFYRRYYVGRNAVIAIVGALDRAQAEAVAERVSGELEPGAAAAPLQVPLALEAPVTRHIDFPSSQTHVRMGQPGMRRDDPDYFPLYVGNHILGGSGLVSRISEEIREKRGLSYSAYSYFMPMRVAGPYTIGLQTRNDQSTEAVRVLRTTLETFIDNGPKATELEASKRNITGGFPLRIASNRNIVSNLATIGFYGLPLDYLDRFNDRIEAVTVEEIRKTFQRRVQPRTMATITVGSTAGD